MVRHTNRECGEFEVAESDFLNIYYELVYKGKIYAYVHIQLLEQFAYCHTYVKRFSAETAKQIRKDWSTIKTELRAHGIEKAVATKDGGIKVWKKFIKLIGFKDIRPIIINNRPCMVTVMEL